MSSWAKPGVKCVCIDDDWRADMAEALGLIPPDRLPMIGEILTVSATYLMFGALALQFEEMGHEWGFQADCFRPLIARPKSIEHDVALFLDAPVQAPAPVKERA